MIEHTLSAYHDITHAAGLAAINPSWMRFAARHRPEKFVQFAERIFGLKAKRADELDIDDMLITRYAQDTLRIIHDENGNLPGRPPMSKEDIVEVLRSAL